MLEWFDSLPDIQPSAKTVRIRTPRQKKRGIKKRKPMVQFLIDRDGMNCKLCGLIMSEKTISIDHIFPKSLGGSNEPINLQLAHIKCNGLKGNKLPLPT